MAQEVTFPRISVQLVKPGAWHTDNEWYRFFETLWLRTGGDRADLIDETATGEINGTEILINGSNSQQFAQAPLILTLSATGVTAQAYGGVGSYPTFTVDAKGRITAAGEVLLEADDIPFDPGGSGLVSTNVGDALRELKAIIDALP